MFQLSMVDIGTHSLNFMHQNQEMLIGKVMLAMASLRLRLKFEILKMELSLLHSHLECYVLMKDLFLHVQRQMYGTDYKAI